MHVKGIIDAAVNGGPRMYRESFFTDEFAQAFPGSDVGVAQLRAVLHRQIALLEKALPLHRLCCAPAMLPLQDLLEEQFTALRKDSSLTS